eukprot:scaffold132798_cov63-Phaeocystis_antarctica.AAC.1
MKKKSVRRRQVFLGRHDQTHSLPAARRGRSGGWALASGRRRGEPVGAAGPRDGRDGRDRRVRRRLRQAHVRQGLLRAEVLPGRSVLRGRQEVQREPHPLPRDEGRVHHRDVLPGQDRGQALPSGAARGAVRRPQGRGVRGPDGLGAQGCGDAAGVQGEPREEGRVRQHPRGHRGPVVPERLHERKPGVPKGPLRVRGPVRCGHDAEGSAGRGEQERQRPEDVRHTLPLNH